MLVSIITIMAHDKCINIVPYFSMKIQLTLVISTSLISNNRLSRSENLVPAYT